MKINLAASLCILAALSALPAGATLVASFDLGGGAIYTGEGPADPASVTWTWASGPGEGPYVDGTSGISLWVSDGTGFINTSSTGYFSLFNDFVYDGTGGDPGIQSASWELDGLNDAFTYDVYFIAPNGQQYGDANVYGGVYVSQTKTAAATGATNVFPGWTEGVNYAVLRGLIPTTGVIAGEYRENPSSLNPNNFGIAGVQVVQIPEPAGLALLLTGIGLVAASRRRSGTR